MGGRLIEARRLFPDAPEPFIDLSTGINPMPYPIPAIKPSAWTRLPEPEDIAQLEAIVWAWWAAARLCFGRCRYHSLDPRLARSLAGIGAAVEIGARALADRAWLEAAKQRLAQDVARLDQILREAGMRVLGGTMLFRLVECGDAFALFRRLGAAGILVWSFDYRHTWLRFGIPGSKDEWLQLAGTLA